MPFSSQAAVKQRHETFESSMQMACKDSATIVPEKGIFEMGMKQTVNFCVGQGHHKECRNELGVHSDVDHFAEVTMNHIAL